MELRRHGPGEAGLIHEDREILTLLASDSDEGEFDILLQRIGLLFGLPRLPRVVVTYQEGLLGTVHAEQPLDLIFVEDDPNDVPPIQIRRRTVTADPDAAEAAIALAERRAGRSPGP